MRKLLVVMVAAIAFAACGSSGGSKSASTTTTTVVPPEIKAFRAATLAGLIASTPKAERAKLQSDMTCMAAAIVDGIGVARLKSAGVTAAKLRDPNFEPPAGIARSMTAPARSDLAVRLQACGFGRIIGSELSAEFAKGKNPELRIDTQGVQCIGRGFDGVAARPMIAGMMLNDVSAPTAGRLAHLMVDCLDMAPVLAHAAGLTLSPTEDHCIEAASRRDPEFVRLVADEFRGVHPTTGSAQIRFGVAVLACLTPAHFARVISSKG